jgi:hypothetical protein
LGVEPFYWDKTQHGISPDLDDAARDAVLGNQVLNG